MASVPAGSALARLSLLPIPPAMAATVEGMFSRLGVRVVETGETLTCIHNGTRIEFVAGIDEGAVDFTVRVHLFQIDRLVEHVRRGALSEVEQFRIACAIFAGAAGSRHVTSNPLMANPVLRKMIRGKNLMHVTLVSPNQTEEPDVAYTIIFINGEQLIVPGHYGKPLRMLRVPFKDAVELQKNLFAGMKAGKDPSKWIRIAKWYLEWRKRVEVPV